LRIFALLIPPLVPAIIDQSIILNLGSGFDCPLLVPEKEKTFLGIIFGKEKNGKTTIFANTGCSQLILDIKNSF